MTTENFDSLLDSTLDDLADLPEFKQFPDGAHRVSIEMGTKELSGKQFIELKMKLIETLELADPNKDEPLAAGTECSCLYDLKNEYGQGAFKEISKPIAVALGLSSLRDIVEQSKGTECVVVTKKRVDKNDSTKVYLGVKKLEVV